jgi:mannosylglycoprotein endo-beta-mannosidase
MKGEEEVAVSACSEENEVAMRACRGQGGDHMIAQDVTAQYVEGWDWILPVPDRNTGLWDRVELRHSGPIRLQVTHQPGWHSCIPNLPVSCGRACKTRTSIPGQQSLK